MAERRAVVIGINYKTPPPGVPAETASRAGMNPLRFAEADAQDMAATLREQGYEVTDLIGATATRQAIIRAIEQQGRLAADPGDLIVLYFAGHGDVDPYNNRVAYLLPADADPDNLAATAIPLDDLARRHLDLADASFTLLDCCHSGYAVGMRGAEEPATRGMAFARQAQSTFGSVRDRIVLAACAGDQVARELPALQHGAFTYYALEFWRNNAEVDDLNLSRYVARGLQRAGLPLPVRGGVQEGPLVLRGDPAALLAADPTPDPALPAAPGAVSPPPTLPPALPLTVTPPLPAPATRPALRPTELPTPARRMPVPLLALLGGGGLVVLVVAVLLAQAGLFGGTPTPTPTPPPGGGTGSPSPVPTGSAALLSPVPTLPPGVGSQTVVIASVFNAVNQADEWVEFYNHTADPLALDGWSLCNRDTILTLPALTIPPQARVRVLATQVNGWPATGLDPSADMLVLVDDRDNPVDVLNWSRGRAPPDPAWPNYALFGGLLWNPPINVVNPGLDRLFWRANVDRDTDRAVDWQTNVVVAQVPLATASVLPPPTATPVVPTPAQPPTVTNTPDPGAGLGETPSPVAVLLAGVSNAVAAPDEWFQIYNGTAAPVQLYGWRVCTRDSCLPLPDLTIDSISFGKVAARDVAGWPENGLDGASDLLALLDNNGSVVDLLNWGPSDDQHPNFQAFKDRLMQPGITPLAASTGQTFSRLSTGRDTNTAGDWQVTEEVAQVVPTATPPLTADDGPDLSAAPHGYRDWRNSAELPRRGFFERRTQAVGLLVLHHTATTVKQDPDAALRELNQYSLDGLGDPHLGYHFYIGSDGTLTAANYLWERVYHADKANDTSVGIALQGDFDTEQPTDAQRETLQWLTLRLLDFYKLERGTVQGHKEVLGIKSNGPSANNDTCPGINFLPDVQAFRTGKNFWPR